MVSPIFIDFSFLCSNQDHPEYCNMFENLFPSYTYNGIHLSWISISKLSSKENGQFKAGQKKTYFYNIVNRKIKLHIYVFLAGRLFDHINQILIRNCIKI